MCFYPGMYTPTHKRHMCICKYIYMFVGLTYVHIYMYVCEYILMSIHISSDSI